MRTHVAILAFAFWAMTLARDAAGGSLATAPGPHFRAIAVSGVSHPDLPAGVLFDDFVRTSSGGDLNAPTRNNNGDAAFLAFLTGPAVTSGDDSSLWLDRNGSLALVAREGQAAPGAPAGTVFAFLQSDFPALSDNGSLVFGATVRTAAQELLQGLWRADSTGTHLLALEGFALPANPNFRVDAVIDDYRINRQGQIAAWLRGTELSTGLQRDGIYRFQNASVTTMAESGRAAGGVAATFRSVLQTSFAINDQGQVAFVGWLEGGGVTNRTDTGIWIGDGSRQLLVVREGATAPGAENGAIFHDINATTPFGRPLTLNNLVDVTFEARLLSATSATRLGTWTFDAGPLELRLENHATTLPGHPDVTIGSSRPNPIAMNDSSQIAFVADLFGAVTDSTDLAVMRDRGAGLELVARTGDPAPGAAPGSVFYDFEQTPDGMAINAEGRLAFLAAIRGPAPSDFGHGLWIEDDLGALTLALQSGDTLQAAPNDVRIVETIYFLPGSGNADGRRSGYDDQGNLAFFVSFTDGTEGMYAFDLHAVPEPNSVALVVGALVLGAIQIRGPGGARRGEVMAT